jgi:hypothetical protein
MLTDQANIVLDGIGIDLGNKVAVHGEQSTRRGHEITSY